MSTKMPAVPLRRTTSNRLLSVSFIAIRIRVVKKRALCRNENNSISINRNRRTASVLCVSTVLVEPYNRTKLRTVDITTCNLLLGGDDGLIYCHITWLNIVILYFAINTFRVFKS